MLSATQLVLNHKDRKTKARQIITITGIHLRKVYQAVIVIP